MASAAAHPLVQSFCEATSIALLLSKSIDQGYLPFKKMQKKLQNIPIVCEQLARFSESKKKMQKTLKTSHFKTPEKVVEDLLNMPGWISLLHSLLIS